MIVEYVKAGAYALSLVIAVIVAVVKLRKCKSKEEKQAELINIAKVVQKIPQFINEAETSVGAGNGIIKNSYVMTKIMAECYENNVNYGEHMKEFSAEVEKILSTPQKKEEASNENEGSK